MSQAYGKYELVEPLAQGGMGTVWKAKLRGSAGFERLCVVKRILAGGDDDERVVKRFVREARLCARLSHRNIVQVFDFGQQDGEYYLAMEYVEGRDVLHVLRGLGGERVPLGMAAFIVREVCRALAYAHDLTDESGARVGLVHRDVSPSNILLGNDGSVRLLDFGVAKALGGTHVTRAGMVLGKPGYMSPEQLSGDPVDARSDLFSIGVVLHELLTGRRLFRSDSPRALADQVLDQPILPPSAARPDVAPPLVRVCMRALERDVARRYARAGDMADELDPIVRELGWDASRLARWLAGGEDAARPPGAFDRTVSLRSGDLAPATGSTVTVERPRAVTATPAPSPTSRRGRRELIGVGAALAASALMLGWWYGRIEPGRDGKSETAAQPSPSPSPTPSPSPSPSPSPTPTGARSAGPVVRPAPPHHPHHVPRPTRPVSAGSAAAPVDAVKSGRVVDPFSR